MADDDSPNDRLKAAIELLEHHSDTLTREEYEQALSTVRRAARDSILNIADVVGAREYTVVALDQLERIVKLIADLTRPERCD